MHAWCVFDHYLERSADYASHIHGCTSVILSKVMFVHYGLRNTYTWVPSFNVIYPSLRHLPGTGEVYGKFLQIFGSNPSNSQLEYYCFK